MFDPRPLSLIAVLAGVGLASVSPPSPAADMVTIPGGDYPLGHASTGPVHKVTLASFELDRHEVTNADFAAFLNTLVVTPLVDTPAGDICPEAVTGQDMTRLFEGPPNWPGEPYVGLDDDQSRIAIINGEFAPSPGYEHHPVVEVTWAGAVAFCEWRDARLPSEAEWEAAARGPDGRTYPWGEAPPSPELAVYQRRTGMTGEVGGRPAGNTPEGIADMAGNVAEWTSSLYRDYPYDPSDGRENPVAPGERVTRGGDYVYNSTAAELVAYFRDGAFRDPGRGYRHIGFRCAR